jgi:hypothetical protein
MNILVLGSAPGTKLPNIKFDYVLFNNGSIAMEKEINFDYKIHLLSNQVFTRQNKACEQVLSIMSNKLVDELVLFKAKNKVKFEKDLIDINYNYKKLKVYGRLKRCFLTLSVLNQRKLFSEIFSNLGFTKILIEILRFLRSGNFRPIKVSTGLLAVAFILRDRRFDGATIYLRGISFSDDGSHFYDLNYPYKSGHGLADKLFLFTLKNKHRNQIVIG